MRQCILSALAILSLVGVALWSAQTKVHDYSSLESLKVGLPVEQLSFLGEPLSITARERVYLLPDQSTLVVAVENERVAAAWLDLRQPLKIVDPQFKQLRFVQMGIDASLAPTWFYAAAADRGRIFKVSQQGLIESITWVKPFAVDGGKARQLQVLLHDFTTQRPYSL